MEKANYKNFNRLMKRLLSIVVVVLACKAAAWAQPTLLFPPSAPNTGENFCVDVKVKDFTDILSLEFALRWDPAVIQFDHVEGFGLPSLTAANFNTGQTADGKISIAWMIANCSPNAVGVTTPDGTTVFRLCFKALGDYGATSKISLDPDGIKVTRVNACPNNIGIYIKEGLVSVGVRALTLFATQETAAKTGDLVCVDVKVNGFDDLTSMQFSVQWDPSVLEFVNVQELGNLTNLAASNFGTPDTAGVGPGKLTLSWSYVDPTNPGVSLPDSTTLFQACFRAIGACSKSSDIEFVDSPTPFEFTNTVVEGFKITVSSEKGKVSIGACDPVGLKLFADCGAPANPNDEVCVKITTAGFNQIKEFSYNLEWNENILQYVGVKNVNGAISGFDFPGDFNIANVSNGVLGVKWATNNTTGVTIPGAGNAGNMFEVCFKVIGVEGGSPVNFTGPSKVVTFTNANFGINPSNCAVEIIKPQGVVMTLKDTEAPLGDTACVDISVANFKDITRYQISLAWEPNHMTFVGINNINLPEASLSNFSFLGVDGGALTFEWEPSTAQTVVDNTVIFKACYEMTGSPMECDDLQVVDQPLKSEAFNTTSNGNNIGVVSQPAEVCILFPEGFFLDIDSVSGDTGKVVCVPVRVASFDNITGAQFPISWEPSALEFIGVQNPNTLTNLSDSNFDITSSGVGILKVNWSNAAPVNIPDSTVIFELCYTLVGTPDDCYEIRVGEPDPVVTTANGGGSMLSDPGEVCIRATLTLVDTIIKSVSCPGTEDGEITLVVQGGKGPLGYTWETIPTRFGPTARNLPAGLVAVTVFDNSNPALILRDTFEIPINPDLPTANAGTDKDFTCNPPIVPLQGQGSQGVNFSYRWRTTDGQLTPNDTTLNTAALAPGAYILEVTNNETGCVARDTASVVAVDFPTADAGASVDFSCATESVELNGSASTTGATIRYKWTALDTGVVVVGTDTLQSARVSAPGRYVLRVTNSASGCATTDTVTVRNIAAFPNANAGADVELPCGEDAAAELISNSNNPGAVDVQWLDLNGQVLSDSLRLLARETGTYVLRVTDPSNNCSAVDTVNVMPSAAAPSIALDSLQALTCMTDTLTLNASISNSTNFVFEWTAENGGQFITGTETTLTPKTAMVGTYQLLVRDTATQCTTTKLVVVSENKDFPTAEAGQADSISCQIMESQLDGTGSSTGADFAYSWKFNGNPIASDTLNVKVTAPGTYYLDVTNKANGCVSVDSVVVAASVDIPQVLVPIEEFKITCQDTLVSITATTNPNYTIEWTSTDGGAILSGQNTTMITTSTAGTYQVKVTNPANGCSGTMDAIVLDARESPPIAAAGADQKITCTNTSVTLNGNSSSVGSDFTYEWQNLGGGQAPSPANAPQASVSVAGMYALVVTNTTTSCVAVDTVVVVKNDTLPQLTLAAINPITCQDSISTLDASGTQPANVSIQWNSLGGGIPRQTDNPLIFEVTQGGQYQVIITNPDNGCITQDTVTVEASADIPQIAIAVPDTLTCTQNSATLDATSSTVNGAFTTEWKAVNGGGTVQTSPGNPLQATATGAGLYQLTITVNGSGCTASAQIDLASPDYPVASAAADKPSIGCGETAALNSAGSSSGTGINYNWSVVSGTGTVTTPTAQNINVDKAGTYQLVVKNAANGCADTATVAITFNIQFEMANAGTDLSVCEPTANLTGNLPAGTTGQWKSTSTATIATPAQAVTSVSNLQTGANRFVWALSAPGCGEYSADTIAVKVEAAPTAANDQFTLKAGQTQGTIVVTSNDNLTNIGAYTVTIATNPILGGISGVGAEGKVGYLVKAGVAGEDEFSYKLCSTTCPSFCDSATVSVLIEKDPNFVARPNFNAITPNGDGLNDQLVFDELLINPEQYPDNELIVFNRWGDIVHTARPYANNWDGTNDTGQPLPEGTYYYILRLNISEGIIIRGDVTVVR